MKNVWLLLSILLLILSGCSNSIFEKNTHITSIEIMKFPNKSPSPEEYSNREGEVISVITSDVVIKNIIDVIEKAESENLENANIALPNYLLIFKNNENVILTLGYYNNNSKDYFLGEDVMYKTNVLNLIEDFFKTTEGL